VALISSEAVMLSLHDKLAAFDPDLPLERAHTIPADWYLDPELYALERRAVFGDTWQAAGLLRDLNAPGAFVTCDLTGEPVVVVCDEAGVRRAFFNVCRHRAAPLLTAPAGQTTRLRCRYHGWTYDLAGRLRGTPEFDGVADFRREDNGLVPLALAEWGPLVWVHAGSQPPPLVDHLAPLPERVPAADLAGLKFVSRRTYEVACNWKVYVDNYLDGGYHVHTIHPALAGVLDYANYHTEVFAHTSVQLSPLKPASKEGISAVRAGETAQYWWVFPNFMLNLYGGVMDTNLVLPLAPDRCRVVFDFYFTHAGPEAEAFMTESMAVADQIQMEDAGICEEVQRGLASRSFRTGRFSVRREAGGYHFHQLLARRLRAAVFGPR
jgi:choline monooxygenase